MRMKMVDASLLCIPLLGIFLTQTLIMAKVAVPSPDVVVPSPDVVVPSPNVVMNNDNCPCGDPQLCKPLNIIREKELFVFSVARRGQWRQYHWDKITTISPLHFHDLDLMCYAHSRNVSIVYAVTNGTQTIINDQVLRKKWVQEQLKIMKDFYYDGVVLDLEYWIRTEDINGTANLVEAVKMLSKGAREIVPKAQVSMCVPWLPNKAGRHAYGYKQVAPYIDFFYIMDYGQGTWGCDNCTTADPNSSYINSLKGIQGYLDITTKEKILLSVPWSGFDWSCLHYEQENHTCLIKRKYNKYGVETGRLWKHSPIRDVLTILLPKSFTGQLWDERNKSPYFIYKDVNGTYHDVRYDDAESLQYKYDLVSLFRLRGAAMFIADNLDYNNLTMVNKYWNQLPDYK